MRSMDENALLSAVDWMRRSMHKDSRQGRADVECTKGMPVLPSHRLDAPLYLNSLLLRSS